MRVSDRDQVPIGLCYEAIERWRWWATLWAAISVLQWMVIIALVGGWL